MEYITCIGIIASAFTGLSLLPQLIKILKEKCAEDISLGMLATLFIGLSIWIYYGYLIKDKIIIVANSISITINLITTVLSWKYKKNKA